MNKILLTLCICMIFAGCGNALSDSESSETQITSDNTVLYDCNKTTLRVVFDNDTEPQTATLFFKGRTHEDIVLPLVPAASGAKYANAKITFWTHRGEASLSLTGSEKSATCTEVRDLEMKDGQERTVDLNGNSVPRGCKQWFDGCNTCKVSREGELHCTRKACASHTIMPGRCIDTW